jgi:HAD superfamily hydrolase (TIGR01509 family)
MKGRAVPLRLVIFDCDGVLVDSEGISNAVLARDFSARGWSLTTQQAEKLFVGTTLDAIEAVAERRLGGRLPPSWRRDTTERIIAAMAAEAVAIPGAIEALHALTRMGMAWRIASNSSHAEMAAKFGRLGLAELVAGRVHSFEDVARGKPAPDIYLAAAAAGRVRPAECVVVEDSVAGATAARAAGMDCLGFDRFGDGSVLAAVGAVPLHDMAELPSLVALALEPAA